MEHAKIKKPWYKRWWAITLFIIIGIGILSNMFSPANNQATNNANTAAPNPVANPTQNTQAAVTPPVVTPPPSSYVCPTGQKVSNLADCPKVYGVGDTVKAGDFSWTFNKVERQSYVSNGYTTKDADGEYLIVDVSVENTGKTAKYLVADNVKLIDGQDREFSPDITAAMYLPPGSALAFNNLNPGIVKEGTLVYDVPKGLTVAKIKIQDNLFQSNSYLVQLLG